MMADTKHVAGNLSHFRQLMDAFEGKDLGYFLKNVTDQAVPLDCRVTLPSEKRTLQYARRVRTTGQSLHAVDQHLTANQEVSLSSRGLSFTVICFDGVDVFRFIGDAALHERRTRVRAIAEFGQLKSSIHATVQLHDSAFGVIER